MSLCTGIATSTARTRTSRARIGRIFPQSIRCVASTTGPARSSLPTTSGGAASSARSTNRPGCRTIGAGHARRAAVLPLRRSTGRRHRQHRRSGNGFPWHFDTNNYTVTLAIQNAEVGGDFEYSPHLRTPTDENYEGVQAVLNGSAGLIRTLASSPATCRSSRAGTPCIGSRHSRGHGRGTWRSSATSRNPGWSAAPSAPPSSTAACCPSTSSAPECAATHWSTDGDDRRQVRTEWQGDDESRRHHR